MKEREITLGSITIGDKIGEGGFGQVFQAKRHPFQKQFAIKLLNPHPFNDPGSQARERFIREAEILLDIRHPYVIPIYDVGEFRGQPYILMEYFKGYDLKSARHIATPSPDQALPFVSFIATALEYTHSKNIVHRDIKPSNLLTVRGDARIVDFGVSHVIDPERKRLTVTGATIVGSDDFAAPELIQDSRMVDPRCDIFSLGACWFWFITGRTPKGQNWHSSLRKIDGITRQYEAVLLRALDSQIDARYQTVSELLLDIAKLRTGGIPAASQDIPDDDCTTILGAIFEHYAPESEPISMHALEKRVSGFMSRFDFGCAIRFLMKFDYVEVGDHEVYPNQPFRVIWPTKRGLEWVESHRDSVQRLLPEAREAENFDDDIPF